MSLASSAPTKPLLVVVGPTQSGKSSLVDVLTPEGGDRPEVGNGRGRSVTTEPKVWKTIMGYDLMDCPGYDDLRLGFVRDACRQKVFEALADFQNEDHGANIGCIFLVVNSLVSDSNRLAPTLAWLRESFGEATLDSTVVLATKADRFDMDDDEEDKNNTLEELQSAMQALLGHNRFLLWRSKEGKQQLQPGDPKLEAQLEALKELLAEVPAVGVEALKDGIAAAAEELCDREEGQDLNSCLDPQAAEELPLSLANAPAAGGGALEDLEERIICRAKQLCEQQVSELQRQTVAHDRTREVQHTEVVGNRAVPAAIVGAATGGMSVGGVAFGIASQTSAAAAAATPWWASVWASLSGAAAAPAAVAMGPVAGAALAGAGVLAVAGFLVGRSKKVKDTNTRVEAYRVEEEVVLEVLQKAEHFLAQAKMEILEEARQSLTTTDQTVAAAGAASCSATPTPLL